jgi:uncharacterized protein YggE
MRTNRTLIPLLVATGVLALAGCGRDGGGTAAAATPLAAAAAPTDGTDTPTIVAQGVGKVVAVPDVLTVSLGIHTQAGKAADALAENNLRTQALLDAIAAHGVDDKDVQTSNISVGPTYGGENFSVITGYQVDNTLTVKLRDLDNAGTVIDEIVVPAGDAIRLQGLGFSVDDPTELMGQARADAVERAAAQAQQLAAAAGVTVGAVRTISEVPTGGELPFAEHMMGGAAADAASVPIAPGSQELSLQVTVVYEIDQ